jgi:hypothetical protein
MPSYPSFVLPFAPVHYDPSNEDDPVDLQVWFNPDAQGDPSKFTTDFELDPYDDWTLDVGPLSNLISDSGILRFQQGTLGIGYSRPVYSLSTKVVPLYGCFKAIYTAGYGEPDRDEGVRGPHAWRAPARGVAGRVLVLRAVECDRERGLGGRPDRAPNAGDVLPTANRSLRVTNKLAWN